MPGGGIPVVAGHAGHRDLCGRGGRRRRRSRGAAHALQPHGPQLSETAAAHISMNADDVPGCAADPDAHRACHATLLILFEPLGLPSGCMNVATCKFVVKTPSRPSVGTIIPVSWSQRHVGTPCRTSFRAAIALAFSTYLSFCKPGSLLGAQINDEQCCQRLMFVRRSKAVLPEANVRNESVYMEPTVGDDVQQRCPV